MFTYLGIGIGLEALVLIAFALLHWLNIPVGNFIDWLIGGASFWWLLVITTVPWNVHFQAKEVLANAAESRTKQIPMDAQQILYVQRLARRSLWAALALHLLSALGLYGLAVMGISAVGYASSGAALLLTGLRPAVRAYEYLVSRLTRIGEQVQYPREDIVELRHRFLTLEEQVRKLNDHTDPGVSYSWAEKQQNACEELRRETARLGSVLEELRATNQTDHQRLAREAQSAIAQLSTDGQVLDHVREIIRFFKTA